MFQKARAFCAQGQEKVPWEKTIAPWEESLAPLAQAVDKDPTSDSFESYVPVALLIPQRANGTASQHLLYLGTTFYLPHLESE